MSLNQPSVYQFHPDHPCITGTFGDFTTEFVKSWDYNPGAVKEEWIYGQGRKPKGRTRGKQEPPSFKVTIYWQGWTALRDYIKSKSPTGLLSDYIFDITLLIENPEAVQKVVATAARITEAPMKSEEGEKPLEVEVTFGVANIEDNGVSLL